MDEEERGYRRTDDAATVEFRTETKGALAALSLGATLIHDCIDRINQSIGEIKDGFGKEVDKLKVKVDAHDDRLARIETSLGMLVKAAWVIAGASASVICMAFWKLVLK